jgi:phage tail sheath protein FI
MVQVSYPGVYVQEVASGSQTITGVATSIAAFVGMAKDGPVGVPTLVLGFTDYSRTFSSDVSQGEMTDQVRQFFLNGGQQAYIVRIGQGITSASATLKAVGTGSTATLLLTAISGGTNGNNLRVIVDYATNLPELTFNLTIFQEITDASGNTSTANQEVHRDLSMDPNNARYVTNVLAQNSALVTGVPNAGNTPGGSSFTAGATQGADVATLINNAIAATGTGQGKFKLSYAGGPFNTISVPAGALTNGGPLTPLTTLINQQMGFQPPGTVIVTAAAGGPTTDQFLVLSTTGTTAGDLLVQPGDDSDITRALGLGTGQGGIEVGLFSENRPTPTGLVSHIGEPSLGQLTTFASSLKSGWNDTTKSLVLSGAGGIPLTIAATDVFNNALLNTASDAMNSPSSSTAPTLSLLNARDNLVSIASFLTNDQSRWQATVGNNSYRMILRPKLGPSTGGGSQFFVVASAPPGWVASATAASIFGVSTTAPVISLAGSIAFAGGLDGSKPRPSDYADAYTALDKVDLFNLLILPRSVGDQEDRENGIWGPASVFAQSRRAFLVMDAALDVLTVSGQNSASAEVVLLRAGLVKDHAALYWPRVKINPDGNPRFIDASGSVAGVMARIDGNRGVWKAPAGIEASINGVLALNVVLSDKENGVINPLAVNAIRSFPNGIVVWGARTMDGFDNSGDTDFKYVPVRRFESFIQESLIRGLKFAVFEPNDEPLWAQIRLSAGAFLNNLFRQGAFAGKTTQSAYFVKVDSETTTQTDINNGIVNVIVGFAPLKPAEFVVITIKQLAGQVQV